MMKRFTKAILCIIGSLFLLLPTLTFPQAAVTVDAASYKTTGFTKTDDVDYQRTGSYIHNWGAREEDCTFLSPNAVKFYTGSNTYASLSANSGSSTQKDVPKSALYKALQNLMKSKHSYQTNYGETRYQYCYTDCELGNASTISSFYSGTSLNGSWGTGWNREHTWPNSKGLGGNDENDIMMLRPTSTNENSSRGNKAYGKSSGYYFPNSESNGAYDLRGDCARIVLYVYVRWGNTTYMWGTSGVMESMSVLLEWMEADPVDTWEMGRNDAVQSITGTRNVFVDYPEFAWQLFGKAVPANYVSPSSSSGGNSGGGSGGGTSGEVGGGSGGNSGSGSTPVIPNPPVNDPNSPHKFSPWIVLKEATKWEDGKQQRTCLLCGETETQTIPQTCNHSYTTWIVVNKPTAWKEGENARTCLHCGKIETQSVPKPINGPLILGCSVGGIAVLGGGFAIYLFKKKKLK